MTEIVVLLGGPNDGETFEVEEITHFIRVIAQTEVSKAEYFDPNTSPTMPVKLETLIYEPVFLGAKIMGIWFSRDDQGRVVYKLRGCKLGQD